MKGSKVYIAVFTKQERHFDECERGYLPLFHSVFCVSDNKNVVLNRIYKEFYDDDKGYEIIDETNARCDDGDDELTFTIKYTDKRYNDVYAIYELEVLKEFIE